MSGAESSAPGAPKVRRNWLIAAAAAAAIAVPMTAFSGTAQAATKVPFNQSAAALAKKLVGDRYVTGGTSPAGFDCSGLTQYVYRHGGRSIQRTAEAQYLEFKRIAKSAAIPGDLVFFHDTSSPGSYVYHVGVYEGGNSMMVAAATPSQGVVFQSFTWGGNTVTFGTITH
jgi:cell wall-associated NlpC family hydrolase